MAQLQVTSSDLRELASKCRTQADAVGNVGTTVDSGINGVDWQSPAATQFRENWTSTYLPALKNLQEALTALGTEADSRATAYDEADRV